MAHDRFVLFARPKADGTVEAGVTSPVPLAEPSRAEALDLTATGLDGLVMAVHGVDPTLDVHLETPLLVEYMPKEPYGLVVHVPQAVNRPWIVAAAMMAVYGAYGEAAGGDVAGIELSENLFVDSPLAWDAINGWIERLADT